MASVAARAGDVDWHRIETALDGDGYAVVPDLLTAAESATLIALYPDRERFRSKVDMARLRFGAGEYKYFAAPLPDLVDALREALYPRVARIANDWMERLRLPARFPSSLPEFLAECRRSGQSKPTPLMLRYEAEGYNCLHQDLYGDAVFPLQFTIMLSRPDEDFTGGEFLLMEQRPRAQSKCEAVALAQGAAILFPTRWRPATGARGFHRLNVRHGVSRVRSGVRFTLGIIFHDAR
jgi:hypothetical protein